MRIRLGALPSRTQSSGAADVSPRNASSAPAQGTSAWLTTRRFVDLGRTESMICHSQTY
ncbi:hypothetical protein JOE57_003634 [Microlunatus panaciterrae]|uniref:Uncharacterized protein n=1 Tax=Microlunatus panaciterrae TaxID=400768 RepID=A0ABS2RNY2_9ACTN|nr:hypothetical protein [Microlunatus panaciterrae]